MTMKNFSALLAGTVFGFGLVFAGMTDPSKVLAFLTLNSNWDPALIFVLGSAVVSGTLGFQWVGRKAAPLFDSVFHAPANQVIDRPLLVGAAVFGVGWGVTGYCPGPALVGAMTLDARAWVFLGAFVVGMLIFERLQRSAAASESSGTASADG